MAKARFRTLDDLDVSAKRVLLRADLNVPMRDGRVSDATRIARLAPTILELVAKRAKIVVMSHFGRPKGGPDPAFSLRPLVAPLAAALGNRPVAFAEDCIGPAAQRVVDRLQEGGVALLENLRFHPGEEANDPGFARQLAALGDLFVEDAFGTVHRAHASTVGVAKRLPAFAGLLLEREMRELRRLVDNPERPYVVIL